MTHDLKSVVAESRTTLSGTATHESEGVAGIQVEVRDKEPEVELEVGAGVVHNMGFAPLEVPPPLPPRDSSPSLPLQHGAASATAGFQWRGTVEVPFALTVRASATVAVEAVAKQTKNEGRVSFKDQTGREVPRSRMCHEQD